MCACLSQRNNQSIPRRPSIRTKQSQHDEIDREHDHSSFLVSIDNLRAGSALRTATFLCRDRKADSAIILSLLRFSSRNRSNDDSANRAQSGFPPMRLRRAAARAGPGQALPRVQPEQDTSRGDVRMKMNQDDVIALRVQIGNDRAQLRSTRASSGSLQLVQLWFSFHLAFALWMLSLLFRSHIRHSLLNLCVSPFHRVALSSHSAFASTCRAPIANTSMDGPRSNAKSLMTCVSIGLLCEATKAVTLLCTRSDSCRHSESMSHQAQEIRRNRESWPLALEQAFPPAMSGSCRGDNPKPTPATSKSSLCACSRDSVIETQEQALLNTRNTTSTSVPCSRLHPRMNPEKVCRSLRDLARFLAKSCENLA